MLQRIPFEERALAQAPTGTNLPVEDTTTFGEALGAGFSLESDVNAVAQFIQRDQFAPDPEFNPVEFGKGRSAFTEFPEQLALTQSEDEFLAMEMRIAEQQESMRLMASRPVVGFFGAAAGAIASPVSLIPLTGQARGVKGIAQAVALAAGAATAQEATLFALQETRTVRDLALGVTFGTVLGGLLGSAAVGLKGREFRALERTVAAKEARGEMVIQRQLEDGSREDIVFRTVTDERAIIEDEIAGALTDFGEGRVVTPAQRRGLEALGIRTPDEALRALEAPKARDVEALVSFLEAQRAEAPEVPVRAQVAARVDSFVETSPTARRAVEAPEAPAALSRADADELSQELADFFELDAADKTRIRKALDTEANQRLFQSVQKQGGNTAEALTTVIQRIADEVVDPAVVAQRTRGAADDAAAANRTLDERIKRLRNPSDELQAEVRDGASPDALDEFPSRSAQGQSAGAAIPRNVPRQLAGKNFFTKLLIEVLAKLNPLTRLLDGRFAAGRFWAAKMQIPNVALDFGDPTGAARSAAEDGTIQARSLIHQAPVVEFIQAHDRAYANHLMGDGAGDTIGQRAIAQIKGSLTVPKGKLTYREFNEAVYDLSNTGGTHPDPFVMESVKAQRKLYDYFLGVHDDYFAERQLIDGEDAQPLFVPFEGDQTGAKEYARHMPDAGKIIDNQQQFLDEVSAWAERLEKEAFSASFNRFDRTRRANARKLELIEADDATAARTLEEAEAGIAEIEESVIWKQAKEKISEVKARMQAAGASKADIAKQVKQLEENLGPQYADMTARFKRLDADRTTLKTRAAEPEARAAAAKELRTKQDELRSSFSDQWRARGAAEFDIDSGTASFAQQAQADALELFNKLAGNEQRIAGLDILGQKRGPQLARVWNLPYEQKKKWLIRNPEVVSRSYVHTMAPDLELYRATGSPNGARMFDELNAEINAERAVLAETEFTSEAARLKANRKFDADAKQAKIDLQGLVERLRHQRGTPTNGEGFAYRAGRAARNVNTFRFMGGVVAASFPDIARPVFRFGLQSTFKNAWLPYINDLNRVKMTRAAAKRMAIATDPVLHNRINQIADAGENIAPGRRKASTVAGRGVQNTEKGLQLLANRIGQIALFDRWTAEMKHHSTGVTLAETSNALRLVNEGGGSAKELKNAQQMLADMSIGPNMQRRIWEQYKLEGGSDEFDDGFRLPNTDQWTDQEAIRALGAGINNIVDDLIITPGLDRSLWMDQNEAFRVVAQYRSFTFTATTRIMLASLQRPDANVLQGIIFSVGLGALSHATWSFASGRTKEYQDASTERKIFEAVERSGVLGVLSEGIRVGEQIPAVNDFAIFGGEGSRVRRANSVLGAVFGPSFDLGERVVGVVQGLDEPTQSTLHTARTLAPFQNVFWLRRMLDQVEESVAEGLNLPERRGN